MAALPPRTHHQPRIEERPSQHYLGIGARASTDAEFRDAIDRNMPAVFRWAANRGLRPAGAPFIRYVVVDESVASDDGPPPSTFEAAVPTAAPARGEGEIRAGVLPAGRWLVTLHRGGFSGLPEAHAILHDWAEHEGVVVDRRPATGGTEFRGAFEQFRIGPADDPDPWRWETDVAYLLRDD